jgi:hypothetical protein
MNKSYIWITTQREGWHKYTGAPEAVCFLRNAHRHIFGFRIYLEVFHNNRDVEFIIFKHDVEHMIKIVWDMIGLGSALTACSYSCEMISDILCGEIQRKYPERDVIIEVSEDGENGSRKEYVIDNQKLYISKGSTTTRGKRNVS